MKASRLIKEYKTLHYWKKNFMDALYKAKLFDSKENQEVRYAIDTKLWEIEALARKLYEPAIGKAICDEAGTT